MRYSTLQLLYAIVIYLTGGILASAVGSPPPLWGNGTHSHGHRDLKVPDNRNYARRFAANLDVGEPRTVRLIHFVPNDQSEVIHRGMAQRIKDGIRTVQDFYADQMEAHGYGRRTFRIETDSQGEPMVHRVDGRHSNAHYLEDDTMDAVMDEIDLAFNFEENVYLISINGVVSNGRNVDGVGYHAGKNGGLALAHTGRLLVNDWTVIAHELGHVFGLGHDFRDNSYIMSYGSPWEHVLSACAAEYLSVHPYFNLNTPTEEGEAPNIELISSRTYPAGSQSIPVRLKVNDSDGLHQLFLFVTTRAVAVAAGGTEVKACRGLGSKREAVIEFDYDGVIPSGLPGVHFGGGEITSLSSPLEHPIRVMAIDTDGNVGRATFSLVSESLLGLSKISGDNQHGLPNTPLPVPFVVEMRSDDGFQLPNVPVTFAVTAGGGTLSVEHTQTDKRGRAESTLTLGPTHGINTVEVSAGGIQQRVSFTAVAGDPLAIPDPHLRAIIETELDKGAGESIAPAEMRTLIKLEAFNANISDLTGLETATNLKELYLSGDFRRPGGEINSNSVSDLSPLVGLMQLRELFLGNNSIVDISALSGLTQLELLWLDGNNISDISALSSLTNLRLLRLGGNNISDFSALAGLTNLSNLYLDGSNISDISALSSLTNLESLVLSDNAITDISVIAGLTNLRDLQLNGNNIPDLSALVGLTNLSDLELDGNNISDISALSSLTNLESLVLSDNAITDISVIASLTQLGWLVLSDNAITDISALAGLTNLFILLLDGNNISDISPLAPNTGTLLSVLGNPLSYQSIHTHIPTLQSRWILVEFDTRRVERLLKISGDNQQGTIGEVLADPFVVEVTDERDTAFAGVPVMFAVTEGSGTLNVTSTTTDENGRAQSTLTLGPDLGPNTVLVSAAETEMQVSFNATASPLTSEYLWSIPARLSLIHVPLKVTAVHGRAKTIESVSDLYDALRDPRSGVPKANFLATYDSQTQQWEGYFGPADEDTPADRRLADDTGILANMIDATSVHLTGNPLGTNGTSTITLTPEFNVVGLPLRDPRINRVSDLLTLDGIKDNVGAIIFTDEGDWKLVTQAGDPSDIPIVGGQAFMLYAQREDTVTISGQGWDNTATIAAAPPVDLHSPLTGIQVTDTTSVLGLKGSIVDEEMGLNKGGFRVTVKNLSTGKAVTAVTGLDKTGYRHIIVDIETKRAATVGDILEISAQSPNPFIGVEPLRYTVTVEDVKRSLIDLPELVAYEIPRETELLANYPNPFNPETWIPYRLAEDAFVTLTIYDQSGRVVRMLEVGHRMASVYESRSKAIYWDGRNDLGESVASGVYFYHLMAGDYSATRRMVIVK